MAELKSKLSLKDDASRGESFPEQCSSQQRLGSPLVSKEDKVQSKKYKQQTVQEGMTLNKSRSISSSAPDITENDDSHSRTTRDTKTSEKQEQEQNWKDVQYRKRQRSSPELPSRRLKQTKLNYWLAAPIPTSNRFEEIGLEDQQNTEGNHVPKPIKPPPMFIDKVSNIKPLSEMLENTVRGDYEIRILSGERVKVQAKSDKSYSIIYKELKKRNTEFFTYQPKQERSFRVVLKNIHPSTGTEELKSALDELQHKATNIWNIKDRRTNKPLPMFYIDLQQNANNKDIYNVKTLLHCRVVFEAPRPKRIIPQCSNCQQHGHTQKFCHRQPRCVKCALAHRTSDCPRKERSDNVKCVLCEGNHPANYKGCIVYQELQKKTYPNPYHKRLHRYVDERVQNPESNRNETNYKQSYAAAVENNPRPDNSAMNNDSRPTSIPKNENALISLNESMQTLMNQMLIITKLLTELVSKLPLHSQH